MPSGSSSRSSAMRRAARASAFFWRASSRRRAARHSCTRRARAGAAPFDWCSPTHKGGASYDERTGERRVEMNKPVVLIVDDEPDLLELVSLTLSRMSLDTRTAPDLASAQRL